MLQLARAQDQTNRHLQQHLQQGQLNMQAHREFYNNLPHQHTSVTLTIYLLVFHIQWK